MLETVQELGDMNLETLQEIFTLECEELDKFEVIEEENAHVEIDSPCHIKINIHSINQVKVLIPCPFIICNHVNLN